VCAPEHIEGVSPPEIRIQPRSGDKCPVPLDKN
jgi:hypothetical protein